VTGAAEHIVTLGRVVGLFGVRGWVKVFSFTEPREAILSYEQWLLVNDGNWQPATIEDGKRHGKAVLAKLAGVDTREKAAELLGREIAVRRADLPETGVGEYYWTDLIGATVWHKEERKLGHVKQMLETGAHDVMVVDGDTDILIPFVHGEVVLEVDIDAGIVRVDWEWD
jgi:16S rRNA processing protein RimM